MRKLVRQVAFALAALAGAAAAHAQVTTGTIVGTVKDAQGAAVPGATVTIANQGQGTSGTYATDADGSFNAPFLIPGVYDVTIELAGFRNFLGRALGTETDLAGAEVIGQ